MDHLTEEFIRRRASIVVGRGKRYPESLRRLAVGFAIEAEAAGWGVFRFTPNGTPAGGWFQRGWQA